jgi:hypothetical protein
MDAYATGEKYGLRYRKHRFSFSADAIPQPLSGSRQE